MKGVAPIVLYGDDAREFIKQMRYPTKKEIEVLDGVTIIRDDDGVLIAECSDLDLSFIDEI